MVEKVFTLQQEVAVLEQRVATLEATGVTCIQPDDATSTNSSNSRSSSSQKNDCVVDNEKDIRTFKHDTFTILKDGSICYCNVCQTSPYSWCELLLYMYNREDLMCTSSDVSVVPTSMGLYNK